MTRQNTLKRRVRARMAKTGEHYASARRSLIDKADRKADVAAAPSPALIPSADFELPTSNEAILGGTGRGWDEWFAILDAWGATEHNHTETARWLVAEQGVDGWWSQSVTVGYERARGLRAKHQQPSGFSVPVSRTVNVPLERLMAAFIDARIRARWLPDGSLRRRPTRAAAIARFDWEGGPSRVNVTFLDRGGTKSLAALEHAKLPDADAAERMKRYWRDRLGNLKRFLEA